MAPLQTLPQTADPGSVPPQHARGAVLVTGAEELALRALVARYRKEQPDREIVLVLRAHDQHEADDRRWRILDSVFGLDSLDHLPFVTGVPGDIARHRLGLDPKRWAALAERVDEIVHGASVTDPNRLELGELKAWRVNVMGTENVCQFGEECQIRGGLRLILCVSSLAIVGDYGGVLREGDLGVGQKLVGAYQRTKFVAERLVRSFDGLPGQIQRLGTVLGDGRCGWIPRRIAFYRALRTLREGGVIAADPSAQFRFITVDDAAERMYHLAQSGEPETYHVVGPRATSLAELVELMKRVVPGVGTQVVEPSPEVMEALQSVLPEFAIRARFDDARARAVLDRAGVRPAREMDESLLRTLFRYVDETDWGARPMSLPDALDRSRRGG